eukprot:scaffold37193_cov75-Phaeocystis_antarctica.AAC.1
MRVSNDSAIWDSRLCHTQANHRAELYVRVQEKHRNGLEIIRASAVKFPLSVQCLRTPPSADTCGVPTRTPNTQGTEDSAGLTTHWDTHTA